MASGVAGDDIVLALDIGGTKLAAGVVTRSGRVLAMQVEAHLLMLHIVSEGIDDWAAKVET